MRRAFIIAAILIVLVGLGVVLYFTFFQSPGSVTVAPGPTNTSLPVAGNQTFPAGQGGAAQSATSSTAFPGAATSVTARLTKIAQGPVVPGEAVVDLAAPSASTTPDTLVSFIERQSGNIFTYSKQTKALTRTSNRTVPGIESAAWFPSGSMAFVQYLSGADFESVNTYGLSASGDSGFFLPQDLAGIAVSSTSILTLASGVNGSTASLSRIDGTHAAPIFSTPLTSLRVYYAGKSQYLAVTKASNSLPGAAFLVDAGGRFTRIAGPLPGLSALPSPSGKWALVSYTSGAVQLQLVNVATGETLPLPVGTIADKCVWAYDDSTVYCGIPTSAGGVLPDVWYQGALSFNDRLWKINVTGRYAQLVSDVSKEAGTPIDMTALSINKNGTLLVFVNKSDGSLWSYAL